MQDKPQQPGQPVDKPQQPKKEGKKEKPKDDWKAAAEAKKLKKEQDRQKDKQKLEQKQQEEKKQGSKPTKQQKPNRPPEPAVKNLPPKQSKLAQSTKPVEQIAPKPAAMPQQQQPLSVIEALLPRRLKALRSIKPDEDALRNVLLQHTAKYFHEDDSVLVASQHAICRQWFEKDVCEVVDIWDITSISTRKENIIRTRFQDVSHLLHTTTKIVCGATAIFQNGVVLSQPGTLFLAMLAHEHRIPFIVFCETHRYCDASLVEGDLSENEGTLYDLIHPKYISMLITEAGPITVCSIPTLVSALYGL